MTVKPSLSNMLWFPKSSLSVVEQERLKVKYTLEGKDRIDGTPVILKAWSEDSKWLGIPRQCYKDYPSYADQTICPHTNWPALQFPAGGGWRGNQEQTVDKLVSYFKKGNYGARLEASCGSGKTLIGLAVAQELGVPAIILVHKDDLAQGWHREALKFFPGVILGHIQGKQWNYVAGHASTCMVQTLWRQRGTYPRGFTHQFGMIIVDEGHRFSAQTFEYVFKVFPARYRLAVSATWRRRDELDAWDYHIGPKVATCKINTLTGRYVPVGLRYVIPGIYPKTPMAVMLNMLARNPTYNNWLTQELVKAANNDRRVLLLSDRIEQLQALQHLTDAELRRCGIRKSTSLYIGSMDDAERNRAKNADVILATYSMMAEGTNIPELDTLIMATPRSDVEQCVGRIQRAVSGKKSLLIVDPVMTNYKLFTSMFKKRQSWYQKLGFKEASK